MHNIHTGMQQSTGGEVVVKETKLSGSVSGTNPMKDNRVLSQAQALDNTTEAKHTTVVVNEVSKEILRIMVSHPINAK